MFAVVGALLRRARLPPVVTCYLLLVTGYMRR